MSSKKVCINHSASYYTGKEQSPLHFGLSAEGYDINSIMEGFDKDLWIVEVRNSKKVWTKKEAINKMTYEVPLITESEVASVASLTSDTSVASEASLTSDTSAPSEANTEDAANVASIASDTTDPVDTEASTDLPDPTEASADLPELPDPTDLPDTTKSKVKISKTVKPTDYTLFISYRIQQLKAVSTDNKKNYDTAREEWKEYKKKPDELKDIMRTARSGEA
jgi:hypothetical protein